MDRSARLKSLVITAMLCALAFVLTLVFHFRVAFLTLDLKDAALAMVSLLFGPIYGVISALVVAFIETVTVSTTGLYGFVMDFLSSGTFALVIGLIYRYRRTFKGAILSVVFGAVSTTAVMLLADLFVIPLFMPDWSTAQVMTMVPALLLPFNAAKSVLNGSLVLLFYKPLSTVLRKNRLIPASIGEHPQNPKKRSLALFFVCLAVIAVTVAFVMIYLNAGFSII